MTTMTARDVVELVNSLFGEESNLLILNALFDIASGNLAVNLLEGYEHAEPVDRPDVVAAVCLIGTKLAFGIYRLGDALSEGEAQAHMREATALLSSGKEPDYEAALPMLHQHIRTMAAMTVSMGPDGIRRLAFYRNPAVEEAQASAFFVQLFDELVAETEADADPDPTDPAGGGTGPVN